MISEIDEKFIHLWTKLTKNNSKSLLGETEEIISKVLKLLQNNLGVVPSGKTGGNDAYFCQRQYGDVLILKLF